MVADEGDVEAELLGRPAASAGFIRPVPAGSKIGSWGPTASAGPTYRARSKKVRRAAVKSGLG